MITKLFSRNPASARRGNRDPRVPGGERIYAIGDIHGRADLFDALLDRIFADDTARGPARTHLILLGDLVDRGPDSREVVERAMELQRTHRDARFLMGNHEEVFIEALTDRSAEVARFFYRIGGRETIVSYGLDEGELLHLDMAELALRLPRLVPQSHLDFMQGFEDAIVIGDYLFVHAGIKPGVALENQKTRHLRWIREDFLDFPGDLGKMVVHGHTISENVEERRSRIGIDTGAWQSGRLTAIGLEGGERWYLDTAETAAAKDAA